MDPEDAHRHALDLDSETLRRLGHDLIDRLVDHRATLLDQAVAPTSDPATRVAALAEPLPRQPGDPDAVLARVFDDILPHMAHVQHPRFFGFVPSPSNPMAVLGDLIASGWNVFAGTWYAGAGALALERTVIAWLRDLCGLPETGGGVLTSGGSLANLTALATARAVRFEGHDMRRATRAIVYSSDQTHTAVARGLRVLGFGDEQLHVVPSDDGFRIDLESLESAIRADRAAGHEPFAVVVNAGTTNTGAVDPLDAVAGICQIHDLWLHVDGAYGAPARMTERGRRVLGGLERADSIALDPHKWLFQPFEIGCVLMREARHLEQAFAVHPEYLRDVPRDIANPADQSVQLTRSFRALKLWLTFQTFGADAVAAAIDRGIDCAEVAQDIIERSAAWDIVTPASLGIVTFRFAEGDLDDARRDRLHTETLVRLREDGFAATTSTVLDGRTVLRFCPINPRLTDADLERTVKKLTALARDVASAP